MVGSKSTPVFGPAEEATLTDADPPTVPVVPDQIIMSGSKSLLPARPPVAPDEPGIQKQADVLPSSKYVLIYDGEQ
jgi:hypothetical protein